MTRVCLFIALTLLIPSFSAFGGVEMSRIVKKPVAVDKCSINTLSVHNEGGKDILLLHGMSFKADTWKELGTIDVLGEAGYDVVAADMPGFGETARCGKNPQDTLLGLIPAAGLDKPVLVGPSMGGRISLNFALDHQDMIGGLVLIGCVGVEENIDRLKTIKVPVLLVWGTKDNIAPIKNAHILDREIPNSRLLIIEGAPHPAYLGDPELWHEELVKFLDENFN